MAGGAIFAPDWTNAEFGAAGATPADADKESAVNATGRMSAISFFTARFSSSGSGKTGQTGAFHRSEKR